MTVGIQRLLETQTNHVNFNGDGLTPDYMVVLNHFWNGRFEAAADLASMIISKDDEADLSIKHIKMYRAWIEALSEMEDLESLEQLGNHLLALGRVEPELQQTYMALRGVIHLYMDQAPAARLVLRAIHGRTNNPYCLEFEEMCARRGFEGANEFAIAGSNVSVTDWFHWNTLLGDLACFTQNEELHDVLHYVNRAYPGCPALDQTNMHRALDSGYWPAALASATKLHANFPDHRDYGFMKAFAEFQSGAINDAYQTLNQLDDYLKTYDADVLHLFGEVLAAKAFETDQDGFAQQSIEKLDLAARMFRRHGKPVDTAINLIQQLEKSFVSNRNDMVDENGFRAPRSWMVMLTPNQYSTMATSGDQELATLHRPMGKEVMPGDVVLFMTKSAHIAKQPAISNQELRIVAVYRVATKPYWHPTNRWQNGLELVDRPDSPIPVDAKEVESDWNLRGKKYSLPRGHHARFGVFELDDSAMDIVVSAVKRRSEGVVHDSDRRGANIAKKDSV